MSISEKKYIPNKTSLYFERANKLFLIGGLPGYIEWEESGYTRPVFKYIQKVLTVVIFLFIAMELGSYLTQKQLPEKQEGDRFILCFSHCIYTTYNFIIGHHKERLRRVIFKLCISLKQVYNDLYVERQMIKKTTIYAAAYLFNISSAMITHGFGTLSGAIFRSDSTMIALITAWPDVNDRSTTAYFGRVVSYLMYWICMSRVMAAYVLVITTMGTLCYQYKHLQSYFYSLNDIFDLEKDELDEIEYGNAEARYEEAFKVGIRLHADTLWCTRQCQIVCGVIYSAHIVVNITVFSILILQILKSEPTLGTACAIVLTSVALVGSTGIMMWNAGDVTSEAVLVATAMYSSGWQHCRGARSRRVRRLVVIAMTQAQRHVVIRCFGIMEVSHRAYVSIVKTSYSVVSLLYSY